MAASMWFYVQHVLIPYQQSDAAIHDRPRGNLSDVYPRWLGARELLLHHRDPYSPQVTREIQSGYYGRPLDPTHPSDPRDQQAFAYPAYVVFLLAPTIHLPFAEVQIGFRWLLLSLTVLTVTLWLRALAWRPPFPAVAILLLLTLGSYPVMQGVKLQQLTLLVSALIAAAAALLAAGYLTIAGILLALASIKPQLVTPLVAWLILWCLADWRRRWHFLAGFGLTLATLFGAAEFILPGWVARFCEAVRAYDQYAAGGSLLTVLTTPRLGPVLATVLILIVGYAAWKRRRQPAPSTFFSFTVSLLLAATVVLVPMVAPYNQVLLLPAVFLIVRSWKHLWRTSSVTRFLCIAGAIVVAWPWLASFTLAACALFLSPSQLQRAWAVPLYTSYGIPLAVLALLSALSTRQDPASAV